jgi:hypothetical protein
MLSSMYRYCSQTLTATNSCWRRLSIKNSSRSSCEFFSAVSSRRFASFDRSSIKGEFGSYATEYDASINSSESFWKEAASALHWFQEPKITLQRDPNNSHLYDWFPDGKINTCYNCLDVHVQNGRGDQTALIYDSPMTDKKEEYTYSELLTKVSKFAGALQNLGVEPGDRVVIYMPLIPQAAIAMLACARIGEFLTFPFPQLRVSSD